MLPLQSLNNLYLFCNHLLNSSSRGGIEFLRHSAAISNNGGSHLNGEQKRERENERIKK